MLTINARLTIVIFFFLNCAILFTQIMSNGIFKSPVHRVVTNAEKERLSVALFYSIDPEREIRPADKLIDENHPALYKKVKIKEYIAGLYEHVARGEMVIETAKI